MKHDCVILAERHRDMLEGVRGLLETEFDTVLMVADDNSLFNTARNLAVDLVVADLTLPVKGKSNIARQFKKLFPNLKIIVLSIYDESAAVEEALAAGAEGFVLKRSAARDLIPAVHAVMAGRKYISPRAGKRGRSTDVGQ